MEPPKRKVTAKVLPTNIVSPSASTPTSPSASSSTPIVVRAKISNTARTRTQSTISSPAVIDGLSQQNGNVVPRPKSRGTGHRSPSPAKMVMRAPSPSKMIYSPSPSKPPSQLKPVIRTTFSKATPSPARPAVSRSHISTVFGSSDANSSSILAPSTLIPCEQSKNWDTDENSSKGTSNSLRIKAKISSLVKPGLSSGSLTTVICPPSPSEMRSPRILSPTATRQPSITFSVTPRATSPSRVAGVRVDDALLVPLPTSPPASNLSFSSHSSTSASASSIPTTSDKTTPSSSHISHSRRVSLQANSLYRNLGSVDEREPIEGLSSRPSSPARRPLVARIRPGTRISGGRSDWSNGLNSINGRNQSPYLIQHDSVSDSDAGSDDNDNATKCPVVERTILQDREDEERAEAKSSRKIADLEITTRSLLNINAALEATKVRQAREIRELRRKLRGVRLSLPPKQFKLLPEKDRADLLGNSFEENEDYSEESDHFEEEQEMDESFQRAKNMIEELLVMGRNALAVPAPSFEFSQPGMASTWNREGEVLGWDSPSSTGPESRGWKHGVAIGTRVLSADEAKKWVDGEEEGIDGRKELTEEEEVERQLYNEEAEAELANTITLEKRPGTLTDDNILS